MSDIAIRVEHLSKQYRIGGSQAPYQTLRESIVNAVKTPISLFSGNNKARPESIWALDDVSFEVKRGEVVGVIGRNGAGKSTLLKILSHITSPTRGRVEIHGRVGSLLEVGTGFHNELTGRENIYLNGAILGMTRAEITRKFDEIVDFAEIEKFLDTPVKHYSSGMYMRLAFAVAAHLEPEILLVDEVLAVGDAEFQKKCLGKMGEVAGEGRTVLFVSHNMGAIRGLCQFAMFLDKGHLCEIGRANAVIDNYLNYSTNYSETSTIVREKNNSPIQINNVSVRDSENQTISKISTKDQIFVHVDFTVRKKIMRSYLAFHLHDSDLNTLIFMRDFEYEESLLSDRNPGKYRYIIRIPAPLLVPGLYRISVHAVIVGEGKISEYDYGSPFEVIDSGSERAKKGFDWIGKINPPLNLEILRVEE